MMLDDGNEWMDKNLLMSDEWIMKNQAELKKELLRAAKENKPNPAAGTTLARALKLFTTRGDC